MDRIREIMLDVPDVDILRNRVNRIRQADPQTTLEFVRELRAELTDALERGLRKYSRSERRLALTTDVSAQAVGTRRASLMAALRAYQNKGYSASASWVDDQDVTQTADVGQPNFCPLVWGALDEGYDVIYAIKW